MKRTILIFVFLIFIIGLLLSTNGSLYKPGNLKTGKGLRSPLTPPPQEGVRPNHWKVAEDIFLYYFSKGKGAPVLIIHGGPGFPPSKPWKGLEELGKKLKLGYTSKADAVTNAIRCRIDELRKEVRADE